MSSKSRIILLLLTMVLTIVLSIYISFAWFSMIETTDPILINTGSLRVESEFYYGVDANYDGIVDEGQYQKITEGGISFNNIIPGQKYPYRIITRNLGSIPGQLSISINNLEASKDILKGFNITFNHPTLGLTKVSFASAIIDDKGIINLPLLNNDVIVQENGKENDIYIFDFVIEVTENITNNDGSLVIRNFLINLSQVPRDN